MIYRPRCDILASLLLSASTLSMPLRGPPVFKADASIHLGLPQYESVSTLYKTAGKGRLDNTYLEETVEKDIK